MFIALGAASAAGYAVCFADCGKSAAALLADSLTVPGAVMVGLGGLAMISETGVFDIFGYAVKLAICAFGREKKTVDYFAYTERQKMKKRALPEMLAVGLFMLTLALFICSAELFAT